MCPGPLQLGANLSKSSVIAGGGNTRLTMSGVSVLDSVWRVADSHDLSAFDTALMLFITKERGEL
jgi:hypothetical protein